MENSPKFKLDQFLRIFFGETHPLPYKYLKEVIDRHSAGQLGIIDRHCAVNNFYLNIYV